MPSDYVPDELVARVEALAAAVEEQRAALRQEHEALPALRPKAIKYRAAAKAVIVATSQLLEAEDDLAALQAAETQRQVAARHRQASAAERRRLRLIFTGMATGGACVVTLAGAGVTPGAIRIVIGTGILLTAGLMDGQVIRAAGVHAVDLRKAVVAGLFAGVAVVGALTWPLAGLAVLPAMGVAVIPFVAESVSAGRERASELEGRPSGG